MTRTHRWAALVLLALVAVGCASTKGGTGVAASSPVVSDRSTAPTAAVSTGGSEITVPSTGSPSPAAATPPPATPVAATPPAAAGSPAFGVCPDASSPDENPVVQCLRQSLSNFWSSRLARSIDQQVVVDAAAEQVPASCRSALTAAPAFTCQVNNVVYLDPSLATVMDGRFAGQDRAYALAVVLAHEYGHVIQAEVKQPGYGDSSQSVSQHIEQQADCLSGVWAHQQSTAGLLDTARFAADAHTLITAISDQTEMAAHGTPQERAAALAIGLQSGRQQACALADAAVA